MRYTTLGRAENPNGALTVSRLGLGCMGMSAFYTGSGQDEAESIRTLNRALDLGVTLLDTAEMYGPHTNEVLLGKVLARRRDEIKIATKFGIRFDPDQPERRGFDASPEAVRRSVEGSLSRLGVESIDLYYLHRVDPNVPIEDTVGAMAELVAEGKVQHLGLSEVAPATIRRAHAVHPITAIQTEYSLWSREPEAEILPTVRDLGIGFVPYSPLGRGFLTGMIRSLDQLDTDDFRRFNPRFVGDSLEVNITIVEQVDAVAAQLGAAAGQVALAWLLAQGEDIVPIPGTKRVSYLEQNVAAESLVLSSEMLAQLDAVAAPSGARYADMSSLNR
ncbi:aldo/keto reductase [Leucobacter coleopterorum]|uniref:Aldo/keto reductase n=1 Tax=Leucobacter coleopterorum TaxID=2714933 RepID=A0ABX6JZ04_9MICO|nr:aldo/keto reductase [Leucobacter coleopterorum]QIM19557.1 aldo/keto reductase [Leucobacter coleopterorum]